MSEDTTITGGAGDAKGGAHSATGGADNAENPAKRAHDGILTELKTERTKRRELEERMSAIEAEKLLGEGKLKEYAESLKSRADKLDAELKAVKSNYAFTTVKAQIERRAQELGCIDSELLLKAIDLDSIQVDDAFKVDTQSLGAVLESARKSKPYLFKQEGQKFRDATPGVAVGGTPDLTKMTKQQLVEFAKNNGF